MFRLLQKNPLQRSKNNRILFQNKALENLLKQKKIEFDRLKILTFILFKDLFICLQNI